MTTATKLSLRGALEQLQSEGYLTVRTNAYDMNITDFLNAASHDTPDVAMTVDEQGVVEITAIKSDGHLDSVALMKVMDKPIAWDKLTLFDSDNEPITDADKVRAALAEFLKSESINGVFFDRVGFSHEEEDDASTWGPRWVYDVDWTGFDGSQE